MKSKVKSRLITSLLSTPITYIPTYQFGLVDEILNELCDSQQRVIPLEPNRILEFDLQRGVVLDYGTKTKHLIFRGPQYKGIEKWLEYLTYPQEAPPAMSTDEPVVCLFKNVFEAGFNVLMQTFCLLFSARYDPENGISILVVDPTPVTDLPEGLRSVISVVDIPKPNLKDIKALVNQYHLSHLCRERYPNPVDTLSRNLQGLDLYEIQQILEVSVRQSNGFITDSTPDYALEEKRNILQKTGVIEIVSLKPTDDFDCIGGMVYLKKDIQLAANLYKHPEAFTDYNIPIPKGVLIIGMPGCGKSMIAKAAAREFEAPLLRLDISRLMGKYVGQSESNLRAALDTAEAAHPCVLWIDEIEKAFRGADAAGGNDILVMRMMGHFLTWMQERNSTVYIVATANDVMRDEFMRKGRFDQVYFVDFPNKEERLDILNKSISRYDNNAKINMTELTESVRKELVSDEDNIDGPTLKGFSGAEINAVVSETVSRKYNDLLAKEQNIDVINLERVDIEAVIKEMSKSIASASVGHSDSTSGSNKNTIEKIRDMWHKYHFPRASDGKTEDNNNTETKE